MRNSERVRDVSMRRMGRTAAALVAIAVALAAAAGIAQAKKGGSPESIVVSCPGKSFGFAFDPRGGVRVTSGSRRLAVASLRGASLSGSCRPVTTPRWSGRMADPDSNIYRRAIIRCHIEGPLRIYLSPVSRGPTSRRNILVTAGNPMTPVVGAMFRRGAAAGPRGTFLYRNPAVCLS